MPESERLQVLRQQRALMLEQLALLDRQIALEAGTAPKAPAPAAPGPAPAAAIPAPQPVRLPPPSPTAEAEAEALLAQLTADGKNRSTVSKTGCWLIFLAFMLLGGVILAAVLHFRYR